MNESSTLRRFYTVPESPELAALLRRADSLKEHLDALRPQRVDILDTIRQKIRIQWTYDSNAIEGSSLTLSDTHFLLQEGTTTGGKPFKDYLDARNHADAIDFTSGFAAGNAPIDEGFLKKINAILLSGVSYVMARDPFGNVFKEPTFPGEYKKHPNQVVRPDGTIHRYVEPRDVPCQMNELAQWLNRQSDLLHPVAASAVAHFNHVRIHPFDDGNGRGARLLMNCILMKKGFAPAIIRIENRPAYILALIEADRGNLEPFVRFATESLIQTQQMILSDLDPSQCEKWA